MPNSASSRIFSLCVFHSGKPPTRHSIRISFWSEGCWSLIFPKEWEAWEFHIEKKIKLLFPPTLRPVPILASWASALLFTLLVFFIYSQIFLIVSLISMVSTTPQLWFYIACTREQLCKYLKKTKQPKHLPLYRQDSRQQHSQVRSRQEEWTTQNGTMDRIVTKILMILSPHYNSCLFSLLFLHSHPWTFPLKEKNTQKATNRRVAASCCSNWESWQGMKTWSKIGALHVFLNCSESIRNNSSFKG